MHRYGIKQPMLNNIQQNLDQCPVKAALEVIGGKWKPLIVFYLLESPNGVMRFNELKRRLPDITQRMLTKHLRELETDGIVNREVYREVPPRVEYSLTQNGRNLKPILDMMMQWGEDYLRRESENRAAQRRELTPN
jgi:DNA-binding HxlR family transcriptional regulator